MIVDNSEKPITKLELDKSKRKLTFADCEPGEEIEAALADNERMVSAQEESVLESILDREFFPSQAPKEFSNKKTQS